MYFEYPSLFIKTENILAQSRTVKEEEFRGADENPKPGILGTTTSIVVSLHSVPISFPSLTNNFGFVRGSESIYVSFFVFLRYVTYYLIKFVEGSRPSVSYM